jgi:hypothetical protein
MNRTAGFRSFTWPLPLVLLLALAAGWPLAQPAAGLIGGHCMLNEGCNSSSWQPCQGAGCGDLRHCECNGASASNQYALTTPSCATQKMGCHPAATCFCSANDYCVGM